QIGKAQREELLVRRAQPGRVVDPERPGRELEELRGAKELDVDGRVLAQEDDVQVGKRRVGVGHHPEVAVRLPLQRDGAHPRAHVRRYAGLRTSAPSGGSASCSVCGRPWLAWSSALTEP